MTRANQCGGGAHEALLWRLGRPWLAHSVEAHAENRLCVCVDRCHLNQLLWRSEYKKATKCLPSEDSHTSSSHSFLAVMSARVELFAWGHSDSDERSRSPSPVLSMQDTSSSTPPSSRSSIDERSHRDLMRWNDRFPVTTQPSRDVILLGLDADVNADMMRTLVTALANMVDARLAPPPQDVTVIRDRNNGTSKGFGFVKFSTLEDAKRFVYLHAPFISNPDTWLGPVKQTGLRRKRIKIDFSNSERPQGGLSYYEQHNAPDSKDQLKKARARRAKLMAGAVPAHQQMDLANENAGLRDASAFPTDMLLLTNVRLSETASSIGAVLCQASSAMEQVLLLRSRSTKESTGRVFVVLRDSDAAKAMLVTLRDRQKGYLSLLGDSVKTSYADAIVMEEADPFDPTNAAHVFEDRCRRVRLPRQAHLCPKHTHRPLPMGLSSRMRLPSRRQHQSRSCHKALRTMCPSRPWSHPSHRLCRSMPFSACSTFPMHRVAFACCANVSSARWICCIVTRKKVHCIKLT